MFVLLWILGSGSSIAQDQEPGDLFTEPYNTGWQLYLDNDGGKNDRDYTGGFAVTLSGARVTEHPFSLSNFRGAIDRWTRFNRLANNEQSFKLHSMEFGLTLFTPDDIKSTGPIFDDHSYASLAFYANSEETVLPEKRVVYRSMLTIGLLGTKLGKEVQSAVHKVSGANEPQGWSNQISNDGEPTIKYSLSVQKVNFLHHSEEGLDYEVRTGIEGNVGFSTDANVSLSGRWGNINSPWWSFNLHQSEYINLGSPILASQPASKRRGEFYFWGGVNAKYRFYNAILQGQFRESIVTFNRSQLEPVIGEAWLGATKVFPSGQGVSIVYRVRTPEIKGPNRRYPSWFGLIYSRGY